MKLQGKFYYCRKYGYKEADCCAKNGKSKVEKNNNQAIEEAEELEDEVVISGICDEV